MNSLQFSKVFRSRFSAIFLLYLVFTGIAFLSRINLLLASFSEISLNPFNLFWAFGGGLLMDTVTFSYYMIPFVFYFIFVPGKVFNSKTHQRLLYGVLFLSFFLLIFNGVSEYFFWEEFGVRYNFIAVDYLIYTTEVLGNIKESYPLPQLITGIFIADLVLIWYLIKKKYLQHSFDSDERFKSRIKTGTLVLLLPVLSFVFVKNTTAEITSNRYNNELAKNGIHSLFAAFLNNELDYDLFYATKDNEENFNRLRTLLKSENSEYLNNNLTDISRTISYSGDEKKYNVVLITVESLSGKFLSYKGSKLGKITPNLDSIANNSLFFSNLYAIGTRTVYGLEAISLASPPKPGQSVVKRPGNEDLFTLGRVFKEHGYQLKYIYGGYGYFDNMNYFFSNNGFKIIDQSDFNEREITFSNAWGVCDQDLFNKVLTECDDSYANGQPFFNQVMTTSNHRPFTYPENIIDIPSHTSRAGGVKYCDYAIGEFIQKASSKPWFDQTLFVIVADHCAGSAGQNELPFMDYQIPLMIYNPKLIQPQIINKLSSQIDLGPTLLGLLNWSYNSKFFGKDILKMAQDEERAFISNYQKLGYIKNNRLTILSPNQKVTHYTIDPLSGEMNDAEADSTMENESIMYYQSANYIYKNKLNR